MAVPRLHPDTIDQVKQRADIVDVVSEHVVLRKQGKDFVGLCPFHDDKSTSFSDSPSKQFYYCFSCGAGGNAIKFLMELKKESFSDVVLELARRYQVPVTTLEPEQRQQLQRQLSVREQLYEILALAARFYEHALQQSQGQQALAYLYSRRLKPETIQQFQLGYAPAGWSTLYGYLVEQKHYPVELVEQAGLIIPRKSQDGYYDRFRDRLMIPIHDIQGRVIGFGGRALGDDPPKYLNSPETELFDKGHTLFGLDKARAAIAKADHAIVVEGYFDVIALHAAGITQGVASLGTALSGDQVKQLLRYTESKQIILNFDTDTAGAKAAQRAIGEVETLAYQGQVQLRVLSLPEGKDPDEFLRSHPAEAYRQLLAQAPLWLDWQIQQILKGQDLKQSDQFQQAVLAIVELLGKLPNATLRTHYIHHCADLLSQGNPRLAIQLEADLQTQVRGQRWLGRSKKWERTSDFTLREAAEAQLLRIYLHCANYRQAIVDAMTQRDVEFSLSHHRRLWRIILSIEEQRLGLEPDDPSLEMTQAKQNLDLITLIRDRAAEFGDDLHEVAHIIQLDEKAERDLLRPPLTIRAASASLERIMCEKRCRHLLDLWTEASHTVMRDRRPDQSSLLAYLEQAVYSTELRVEQLSEEEQECVQQLQQAARLQKLFREEKRYLQQLDQQRCMSPADISQTPMMQPRSFF